MFLQLIRCSSPRLGRGFVTHSTPKPPAEPRADNDILNRMRYRLLSAVLVLALPHVAKAAGSPIELELVTEQGVQITAPQQWLQLLAGIGIEHVQIHGGGQGDEPKVTNRGNAKAANYLVVGVLSSRDQLLLPGGTFTKADRGILKD
jgi:hypothetical protein